MNKTNSLSTPTLSAKLNQGILLEKTFLTPSIVRMRLSNEGMVDLIQPGHFVNIKVSNSFSPLLRRPFSVHHINKQQKWFEILFQIIGKGTQLLADTGIGVGVDLLGPLGNSFVIRNNIDYALLVAGGLGIAPLLLLSQKLKETNIPAVLFWGNRSKDAFAIVSDFEELEVEIHMATDDGSSGFKGTVTELLNRKIEKYMKSKLEIFACGPNPMLKKLNTISINNNIPCQISLETMMACGFGVCMGCNVTSNLDSEKYKYVCKHGPVFDSREIELGD